MLVRAGVGRSPALGMEFTGVTEYIVFDCRRISNPAL